MNSLRTLAQCLGAGGLFLLCGWAPSVHAQTPIGTAFTYQGQLNDAGLPANGIYDFEFKLFDASTGGTQVGSTVMVNNLAATAGLFVSKLDFGQSAFSGSARFLEIGVRPGVSVGAYTLLLGRVELTPGPNSLFATTAGTAVTVNGLTCSDGQIPKWSGGSWTCGNDANNGGTVTSLTAGSGLSGGTITGSGTVAIANGGVVSAMIASGAVGATQIDPSQVQTRVTAICPSGQFLRGVNSDGSVVCGVFYLPNASTAVDSAVLEAGIGPAVVIGTDGLPVISYKNAGASSDELKVAKCGNVACTGTSTVTTIDSSSRFLDYISMAIGTDGLPVISYGDRTNKLVKVAKCINAACTGASAITTIESLLELGPNVDVAIGTDGLPVLSYQANGSGGILKVARCTNAACTGSSTITVIGPMGTGTAWIRVPNDGLPIIASGPTMWKCLAVGCTMGTTAVTYSPISATGMAIGADGFPVVSYEGPSNSLGVLKCLSAACSGSLATVDDSDHLLGAFASISVGADGLPVVSYSDQTAKSVKIAKCRDAACSRAATVSTVAEVTDGISATPLSSIAVGTDGLPVIAYYAYALKVAKCNKASCSQFLEW